MADNPASWFILMCAGLYFIARFLYNVYKEDVRLKEERQRASNEFFYENSIDKSNIAAYNRYVKDGGRYERNDDRHRNMQ